MKEQQSYKDSVNADWLSTISYQNMFFFTTVMDLWSRSKSKALGLNTSVQKHLWARCLTLTCSLMITYFGEMYQLKNENSCKMFVSQTCWRSYFVWGIFVFLKCVSSWISLQPPSLLTRRPCDHHSGFQTPSKAYSHAILSWLNNTLSSFCLPCNGNTIFN